MTLSRSSAGRVAALAVGAALALAGGRAAAQGALQQGPPWVTSFGPVHMTAEQDLLLAAFLPAPGPPGLGEAVGPPCVVFRVFDDTGALVAEQVSEGVAPGTGVALAAKGTDLFEGTNPPYITAEINLERSPPFLPEAVRAVAGDQNPPTLPTLQLLDGATGRLDLVLGRDPPWDPRCGKSPPYRPPLHVTDTDDLLLAYAGVGGETVRLVLVDETGARRFESEPLVVPEGGGGVALPLDGATVVQGVGPAFVVGLVELLAPAESTDPPYLPGLFSLGVLDVGSGRTRGLAAGRPLFHVLPAPEPLGPPEPGCDPTCEPPPGA